MIFESHAHYDDVKFDEDRETLLAAMPESGVEYIINVGADLASTQKTLALTEKYAFIYGAAGVHPSETGELDEEKFEWLAEQCSRPKIIAVGGSAWTIIGMSRKGIYRKNGFAVRST